MLRGLRKACCWQGRQWQRAKRSPAACAPYNRYRDHMALPRWQQSGRRRRGSVREEVVKAGAHGQERRRDSSAPQSLSSVRDGCTGSSCRSGPAARPKQLAPMSSVARPGACAASAANACAHEADFARDIARDTARGLARGPSHAISQATPHARSRRDSRCGPQRDSRGVPVCLTYPPRLSHSPRVRL